MKRRLFKLVVFILLGTVVNVAVAWGCAYWVDVQLLSQQRTSLVIIPGNTFFDIYNTPDRVLHEHHKLGATQIALSVFDSKDGPQVDFISDRSTLIRHLSVFSSSLQDSLGSWSTSYDNQWQEEWHELMSIDAFSVHDGTILVDGRGWPLLSLYSSYHIDAFYSGDWLLEPSSSGIKLHAFRLQLLPKFICEKRALPLYPIWSGFAINTVFYAVIAWTLWSSPSAMRRFIRSRRGRCIKCGYDLRSNSESGCPECGWGREAEA